MTKIGIIGGSGLEDPKILKGAQEPGDEREIEEILEDTAVMKRARETVVTTAYGDPSSPLVEGTIRGVPVVLLSRHGKQHTIPPTQVNYRANIQALKDLGCTHILATTACGSLREDIHRGDFVILDQFIDFTRRRVLSFFEHFPPGETKHTPMADPFSEDLRRILIRTAEEMGMRVHPQGTVVTIEGPRFSTRAESRMFRLWGADVVNMSVAPETILANELRIPYAAVALSTDYDCWKTDELPVTWDEISKIFNKNVENVTALLLQAIPKIGALAT